MKFDPVSFAMGTSSAEIDPELADATASRADILYPKTAYLANGKKNTGTIQSLEATTYTPSTIDQTISAGKYLAGDQVILGDDSLVAENIRKDISIFGVTGVYDGISNIDPNKPIKLIDYNGTLLYTYTPQELDALTEWPMPPSQDRLIAQGWNWSLSDAKAQVASTGEVVVGQTYITKSRKTEIDIELTQETLHPYFCIGGEGDFTISWGDKSLSAITLQDPNSTTWEHHLYFSPGSYTITITVNSGNVIIKGASQSGSTGFVSYTSGFTKSRVYGNIIKAIWLGDNASISPYGLAYCQSLKYLTLPLNSEIDLNTALIGCYSLQSLTIPIGEDSSPNLSDCQGLKSIALINGTEQVIFSNCYALEIITLPNSVVAIPAYGFYYCYKLRHITLPSQITQLSSYVFCNCYILESISLSSNTTTIGSYALQGCNNLRAVTIPAFVTQLQSRSFQQCYSLSEIHFLSTTPPTATAFDVFGELAENCKIYVPTGSLSTYTSATNYPSSATYTYVEE